MGDIGARSVRSDAENFSSMSAAGRFDWTCPHCGNVEKWNHNWTPEGRGPIGFHCRASSCKTWSHRWIWCRNPGWMQIRYEEERDGDGLPRLDDQWHWMFICECGEKHCPSTRHDELNAMSEPAVFPVNCKNCGRERTFKLIEGKWQQLYLKEPTPEPSTTPEPPSTESAKSVIVKVKCANCQRVHVQQASGSFCCICPDCRAVTAMHRSVSEPDKWTGEPHGEAFSLAHYKIREVLERLWKSYQRSSGKKARHALEIEALVIAEDVLRFVVGLAADFQALELVGWLSWFSDLAERRMPRDWHQNIKDRITKGSGKERARQKWNEVEEFKDETSTHVPQSPLNTWTRRIMGDAVNWRAFVRSAFPKETGEHQRMRRKLWSGWLVKHDVTSKRAKQWPFPARFFDTPSVHEGMSQDEAHQSVAVMVDALVEEIIFPLFAYNRKRNLPDWLAICGDGKGYADSKGRLQEKKVKDSMRRILLAPTRSKPAK